MYLLGTLGEDTNCTVTCMGSCPIDVIAHNVAQFWGEKPHRLGQPQTGAFGTVRWKSIRWKRNVAPNYNTEENRSQYP